MEVSQVAEGGRDRGRGEKGKSGRLPWFARPAWYLDALLFWALFTGGTLFMIWLLTANTQSILRQRLESYVGATTRIAAGAVEASRNGGDWPGAFGRAEGFLRSILEEHPDVKGIGLLRQEGEEVEVVGQMGAGVPVTSDAGLRVLLLRAARTSKPVLEGWGFADGARMVREAAEQSARQVAGVRLGGSDSNYFLVCVFDSALVREEFVLLNESRVRTILLAVLVGTLLGLLVRRRTIQREEAVDEKLAALDSLRRRDQILGSVAAAADRFLTADEVEEPQAELTSRIREVLGVDRVWVERVGQKGEGMESVVELAEQLDPAWNRRVALSLDRDTLTGEGRQRLEAAGWQGLALFPIVSGQEVLGHLVVGDARAAIRLEPGVEDTLRIVADLIGAAMVRRRNEKHFREVNKEQALGRMAGGVAHEFNNLLHIISGNLQGAGQTPGDWQEQQRRLSRVAEAARRGTRIVAQLLRATRQSEPVLAVVDLNGVVERTLSLMASTLPPNIRVDLVAGRDLPKTALDEDQISQVIVNLVLNAKDAVPENGLIRVETGYLPRQPGEETARVFCRVEDNGPGLSGEVAEHLFDPFFTTKPPGQGTGLGLPTCRGIVERHGGVIEAGPSPLGGARFTFRLPVHGVVEGTAGPVVPERERRKEGGGKLALVADDEPMCLDLVEELLREEGFEVCRCQNGEQLLEEAGRLGDHVALVVTDWTMPGPPGPALVMRLRDLVPMARVVVASGFLLSTDEVEGIDAVLQKPFGAADLAVALGEGGGGDQAARSSLRRS
ncbi:MAG: ATP-binding protein [Verrucomicrobiia bacterium]